MAFDISKILKLCVINEARLIRIEVPEDVLSRSIGNEPIEIGKKEGLLQISEVSDGNNILFSVNLQLVHQGEKSNLFASEKSVEFELSLPKTENVLGNAHYNPCWMGPQFCKSFDELSIHTQGALLKNDDEYIYLLPLNGDNCYCEFGEGRIYLSIGSLEYDRISGHFLCASRSSDPYEAIKNAYSFARINGGIKGKLIEEKEFPEMLKGLGFCTWNMCYNDLTSEKIYRKLDELRRKNIPVKWFLFDNGWLQIRDGKLMSFKEDKEKLPEGLKECIRRIKKDYGIKNVGIWHTFNGYGMGIHPDGELYKEQKNNLEKMPGETINLSADEHKAFCFWDSWHTYLEECGVDFIKVDSQSTYPVLCEGKGSNIGYTRSNHMALEKSAEKHFNGAIINCMGMDMQNVLERGTAISRTSGDFDPFGNSYRFYKHLRQNAWNNLWHGRMYYGDSDMFWSSGPFFRHESVMRAISGGPIYISDETDATIAENLRPCINEDGSLPLMEHNALPTKDILFTDCYEENRLIKLWNEKNGNFALALFAKESVKNEIINLTCIPGIDINGEYVVYEFFSKSQKTMKGSDSITVSLEPSEVQAYSIMPIRNGKYDFFDERLYFPFAGNRA